MASSTTTIGDRRRVAGQRSAAARRHPTHRPAATPVTPPTASYYAIAVIVAVFTMLGLVMVLSATSIDEVHQNRSPFGVFQKQLVWAALGLVGLVLFRRVPYHAWRKLVPVLLLLAMAAMLAPLVPGVGRETNGARAWINIGSQSVQPSEFLKLVMVLFCAHVLTVNQQRMNDWRASIRPVVTVGAIGCGLCLLQKDLGTAIVLACIVLAALFIAGAPLVPMAMLGVGAIIGATMFVVSSPRRVARFTAFLDLAGNKDYRGYQTWQAQIALVDGGLAGQGVGSGSSNLGNYVPLAHSDFIFAVIAEELGMIGIIAVVGGFLALAYAGVQAAVAAPDRFGQLVAGSISAWLLLQMVINVGGVTGLMPVTGLTLPFFSAGGSSLLVSMCAAGLLLNVARSVR